MDLIGQLAGTLGLDATQAQAVAGTVLGAVQKQADPQAAEKLGQAVPELSGWKAQAAAATQAATGGGLGGGLGGLLGAAAGALGGQQARDMATVITLLGKFGVDTGKATMVAPMILSFLKERVDANLLQTLLSAAPLLTGAAPAGAPATAPAAPAAAAADDGFGLDDAASMLGGLFGKKR